MIDQRVPYQIIALLFSMPLPKNISVTTTVLCIDDEPSLLQLERRFLESHGYLVLTAGNGREALRILSASPVDAVVLDYQMPEMDGFSVALEIRRMFPEIDIIIHSGTPLEVPNRMLEIADRLVAKGEPSRLVAALEALGSVPTSRPKLRLHPRCRVKLKAMLTLKRSQEALTGWIEVQDLSEGGIGGETSVELGVGDVVSVDVMLPEISMLLATDAAVRHHLGFFHGLEFLGLRDSQREAIRQFCHRLYPTSFLERLSENSHPPQ
jgi:CheY-like chemotaxis protein